MILRKPSEQLENPLARAAFTLMEMLVVVAIIVALAGLGGYYVMGQLQNSQKKTAKLKAVELSKAVENYMIDHNNQPPPSLNVLTQPDGQGNPAYLKTQDALLDPWGKQYQYDPSGQHNNGNTPSIFTQSPDGKLIGNF